MLGYIYGLALLCGCAAEAAAGLWETRSWQQQCLSVLLYAAVFAHCLVAVSSRDWYDLEDTDVSQTPTSDCTLCIVGDQPEACISCYLELQQMESARSLQAVKRGGPSRRNSGCGCCVMSRFKNSFCCNVCHNKRNG